VSIALPFLARGRHKPGVVNARLRRENRELDRHNAQLVAGVEERERDLHTALLRGCQDAILIAQLQSERDEYAAAVARMEDRHGKEIRAMNGQLTEMARRLELRSMTEAVVTKTQPIPEFIAGTKRAAAT